MSNYIQFYQIEGGVALQNRVTTIEDVLQNGDFEVNEFNTKLGVIQRNLMIGFTNNTDLSDDLVMEVSGTSLYHGPTTFDNDVQITGNTIFGKETSSAEEVANNDTNVFVYGDLRIMDGGNIVIEDICNTTVTELRTEVKITDSIDISNDGTTVAMIVNQIHTEVEDIVQFQDDGVNVFTIGNNGNTFIKGDVSINSVLDISGTIITEKKFILKTDSSEKITIDTSNVTILNNDPSYSALDISATSALTIPIGTSEQRPIYLKAGQIRYNTTNSQFEGYNTTDSWQGLGGVIDIDQDTKIIAETNPLDDNDEIQIFTASFERMKIDACGNIQMFNSDPSYSALDISATSALTIPIGSTEQRPTILKAGQIRYNTTNSQFEGYNTTDSWQGLGGVIDIDQDTKIIAETNPLDDNDEIQIFTASFERMKIDACGNIQMFDSDPSYSALDISATSALTIPIGTTEQRPSVLKTGQIRYNTTNSQFEGYNPRDSWEGLGGVIDADKDTKIIAETNPLDDNDAIQIFTASFERMKVDASGNIQMFNSDSTYPSLDISATGSISIPRGTTNERPTTSSIAPRSLRFNSDTSLCEVYTESSIWSGIPVYKAEQPPSVLNITQDRLSETVTVNWEKFADIYKDVFDGKCYPIYLQTFVDISFTNINGVSSNGWETIIIGSGNYNETGNETTPLTSFVFNSVVSTNYNDNNKSDDNEYSTIDFTDKPTSTINLPVFTQDDSFDLRIYGVNKSGTLPNYNYIYNVQLKQTEAPGEIDVVRFETFSKTEFYVDLSFDLDSADPSITSMTPPDGISITNYDVSFTLSGTKSLTDRTHSDNQFTDWTNATSLSKDNLRIYNLFPGAQYDIQIRAQNALKLDPTSTTGFMYGNYGDVFTSSGFTNNSSDTTGTNTTEYIDTGDLNSVSHNGLAISLVNTSNINCYVNGNTSRAARTIANSTSYINISGTSEFYINYGLQGTDMIGVDNLVQANVDIKKNNSSISSQTITYNGTNDPTSISVKTIDISNGGASFYQFSSGGAYSDKYKLSNYNDGFVYSSTFSRTDSNNLNTVFVDNFPASTDYYYLSYTITSQSNNNSKRIDEGGNTNASKNTGNFYVDDYLSTPDISWTQDPTISVNGSTVLFGIPSVSSVNLQYGFDVSGFASHIIPTVNNIHSYVAAISKNSYEFSIQEKTGISSNTTYNTTFNSSDSSITNARYDDTTTSDVTIYVYYLDNVGNAPTIATYTNNDKDVSDIGHIFKDTVTSYSAFDLYSFNGSDTIGNEIVTNNSSFETTYSSVLSSILLYFNDRFVSGGYNTNYTSTTTNLYPFGDWTTSTGGYAVDGPDYSSFSNTGINGFKWIVLDVTSKKSGNTVTLTNFLINGSSPDLSKFSVTNNVNGYEAYIYQDDGKFGTLSKAHNTGATSWFGAAYNDNISNANSSSANGVLQSNGIDAFVDSNHSGNVYLIVGLAQNQNSYFTFS